MHAETLGLYPEEEEGEEGEEKGRRCCSCWVMRETVLVLSFALTRGCSFPLAE